MPGDCPLPQQDVLNVVYVVSCEGTICRHYSEQEGWTWPFLLAFTVWETTAVAWPHRRSPRNPGSTSEAALSVLARNLPPARSRKI
jgi:hypothetical protein